VPTRQTKGPVWRTHSGRADGLGEALGLGLADGDTLGPGDGRVDGPELLWTPSQFIRQTFVQAARAKAAMTPRSDRRRRRTGVGILIAAPPGSAWATE
jgi:hypothetical protein